MTLWNEHSPATVFVGQDGRVKAVHSGFASPASGEFNRQLQQEFTARIEQLLAQKPAAAVVQSSLANGEKVGNL
jgi:hypothetical protein